MGRAGIHTGDLQKRWTLFCGFEFPWNAVIKAPVCLLRMRNGRLFSLESATFLFCSRATLSDFDCRIGRESGDELHGFRIQGCLLRFLSRGEITQVNRTVRNPPRPHPNGEHGMRTGSL